VSERKCLPCSLTFAITVLSRFTSTIAFGEPKPVATAPTASVRFCIRKPLRIIALPAAGVQRAVSAEAVHVAKYFVILDSGSAFTFPIILSPLGSSGNEAISTSPILFVPAGSSGS
jgi:hypothetical protein